MSIICINKQDFAAADRLAAILEDRLIAVQLLESSSQAEQTKPGTVAAFVCSATMMEKSGGQDAVITLARGMRAGLVMIIDEKADVFSVNPLLGGKLIHITLPAIDANCHRGMDYSLQMAASLVSTEHHIAAAEAESLRLMGLARRVAATDVTVFINGPTGTGKEVLSKFVHHHSARRDAPFVGINCAAIPENMLEAILFGHEKGAFTGASTANKGIFRAADGGTLLLDEISEMPLALQAKLLRALQEKSVTPIGSQTDIAVDVRVIATTNRNMSEEIRQGNFREDLYYRLNVFPLNTASLAERPLDIIPIATVLLKRHCQNPEMIPWLSRDAVEILCNHQWPGNVREVENVLQRALVLATDKRITGADIILDNALERITEMLPQPERGEILAGAAAAG